MQQLTVSDLNTLERLVKYSLSCISEHKISTKHIVNELYNSNWVESPRDVLIQITSVFALDNCESVPRKQVEGCLNIALINIRKKRDVIKGENCLVRQSNIIACVNSYLSRDAIANSISVDVLINGYNLMWSCDSVDNGDVNTIDVNSFTGGVDCDSDELENILAYCIAEKVLNSL